VHLVGFIIEIYYDAARYYKRQSRCLRSTRKVAKETAVNKLNNKFIMGKKLQNVSHRQLNNVCGATGQHTEQSVLPKVDIKTTDENSQAQSQVTWHVECSIIFLLERSSNLLEYIQ
jgi:hypothetical protein